MHTILMVLQVFLAIGLTVLVLLQHGRGADAGAAFGSGASATVFGARGAASFLTRTTAVLAALFFVNSLVLSLPAVSGSGSKKVESVMEALPAVVVPEQGAPAAAAEQDVPVAAGQEEAPLASVPAAPEEPVKPVAPATSDVPAVPN